MECSIVTCFDALGGVTQGFEFGERHRKNSLADESELSQDEKEIVGVFRERGEICMAEVEKLLRRKRSLCCCSSLIGKKIIGIKESVDESIQAEKLNVW